jgi:hypothetical protein
LRSVLAAQLGHLLLVQRRLAVSEREGRLRLRLGRLQLLAVTSPFTHQFS